MNKTFQSERLFFRPWSDTDLEAGKAIWGDAEVMKLIDFEDSQDYELNVQLSQNAWGKGYATEAAQTASSFAFTHLGSKKIVASTHPENKVAQAILEKIGFTYLGPEYSQENAQIEPFYELTNPEIK